MRLRMEASLDLAYYFVFVLYIRCAFDTQI